MPPKGARGKKGKGKAVPLPEPEPVQPEPAPEETDDSYPSEKAKKKKQSLPSLNSKIIYWPGSQRHSPGIYIYMEVSTSPGPDV